MKSVLVMLFTVFESNRSSVNALSQRQDVALVCPLVEIVCLPKPARRLRRALECLKVRWHFIDLQRTPVHFNAISKVLIV